MHIVVLVIRCPRRVPLERRRTTIHRYRFNQTYLLVSVLARLNSGCRNCPGIYQIRGRLLVTLYTGLIEAFWGRQNLKIKAESNRINECRRIITTVWAVQKCMQTFKSSILQLHQPKRWYFERVCLSVVIVTAKEFWMNFSRILED